MAQFSKQYEVHSYPLSAKLLDALIASYIDWGGTSKRPQMAIVDWREVPTWSEFEILQARFEKMGVPGGSGRPARPRLQRENSQRTRQEQSTCSTGAC